MADPDEGVAPDGTIRTGVMRSRVPAVFEPVLTDAIALADRSGATLYLYGSVATGRVRPGCSDVDLLSIDLPDAAVLGQRLSARYIEICRSVEMAAATAGDLAGETDEAYGFRVFLRHYCVHLAGQDPAAALPTFQADARAARGFNGDIGRYLGKWRQLLNSDAVTDDVLGVRIARKTLLAVAGLVSVHDHTWTTDRARAVQRWSELEPDLEARLRQLHSWAVAESNAAHDEIEQVLTGNGIVAAIVRRFSGLIGLWTDSA